MSEAAKGVFRLLDIVVEEVSLVDRAANKHRFLIVKRSEMDDETSEETPPEDAPGESPESTAEDADDESDDEEGQEADDGEDDTEPSGERPPVVDAAVDALTKLTSIVETFESGTRGPKVRKARAALRELAAQLAKASKPKGRRRAKPAPDDEEELDEDEDEDDETQEKSSMADIRAALARLQALVSQIPGGGGGKPKNARGRTRKQADGGDTVGTKLDAIATQLGTVATGLKEHTQRLSRLEKHAGVPNSAPVGEGGAKNEDDDGFWSLDLNKPADRASVDKAISFHDFA